MIFRVAASFALACASAPHAAAQLNSSPQALPIVDTVPPPRDVPFPGTIRLAVDATDTERAIFTVEEKIPVAASGALTLLYPKWIPGDHGPAGPIDKLAGLRVTANGKPLAWRRDPIDVFAFHLVVPEGVRAIDVAFQYLSPTDRGQGRVVMTPAMLNIEWNTVALYPAGWFVRQIPIEASVSYPKGWTPASALEIAGTAGDVVRYKPVAFDTLMDSPVFAGRHTRTEAMAPGVRLNIVGDTPESLAATPAQIAAHRNLVTQAIKLFGVQHYDHYDFLMSVSDTQGSIGLEHHRSSENGVSAAYFNDWDARVDERDTLPHEFTHSWNGKFRRPADLWTPDYRTPMRNSLLWVYEGQTTFWGQVLAARSGLWSKEETLGLLASEAAMFDKQVGRTWRPLADTTNNPIIPQSGAPAWRSWQRSSDYYIEGELIWLDVDSLIRGRSGGKRSLDDFARAFFGVRDRDWGELTYTFDDVVAALNGVMPHDWASFLHARLDVPTQAPPLDWIDRGGYRLIYTDEPTSFFAANEKTHDIVDLSYSLGLTIGRSRPDGAVRAVSWEGPAFDAGLTVGTTIVAVGGQAYTADALKAAIRAAKDGKEAIRLLVRKGETYREVALRWNGGLRYPRLVRTGTGPSSLDALLAPR